MVPNSLFAKFWEVIKNYLVVNFKRDYGITAGLGYVCP